MPGAGSIEAPGPAAPQPFGERLAAAVAARESQIVLGIDPDPARLWPDRRGASARHARALAAALGGDRPPARRGRDRRPRRRRDRALRGRRRGARPLPRADRRRRPGVRRRQAAARLLRAPRLRRLARARARLRARARRRPARARRRQARRRPGDRRRLRQALVGSTRRRSARPGLGADAFTANPLLGRDALDAARRRRACRRRRRVRARPHLQPRRRRRARPARWRTASRCGSAWPRMVDELGEGEPLADVGAVTGATVPEHLARMRELMPRTPFLLPGVGAQGGDVAALAPGLRAGRAGGLVTASRSIANAGETPAASPADGRPRGGRAAARRPHGRWPERADPGAMIASMAGRSPARFLAPLALVAVVVRPLHGRQPAVVGATPGRPRRRRRAADRRRSSPPRSAPQEAARCPRPTRSSRRHAVRHRREDRRPARQDPGSSTRTSTRRRSRPGRRSSCASDRPRGRRSRCSPPSACSSPRPRRTRPGPRRLPGLGHRAERDRDRGLHRRGRAAPSDAERRRADRLDDEADDRAARRSSGASSAPRCTTSPLPAAAGRVEYRAAAGRADDGRATCCAACSSSRPTTRRWRSPTASAAPSGAFVRLMNRARPPARAHETRTTRTRSGSTRAGNYSTARDLVKLAAVLRTQAFFRRTVDSPGGDAALGRPPARRFRNRNDARAAATRGSTASRPVTPSAPATCSSARPQRHGVQVVSAVLGTPDEGARDAQTLALLRAGLAAFRTIAPAREGRRVPGLPRCRSATGRGAELRARGGRNAWRRVVRRGHATRSRCGRRRARARSRARSRRGQELGDGAGLRGGKRIATRAARGRRGGARASVAQRTKRWFTTPWAIVLAFAVVGGTVLLLAAAQRPVPAPRPRREAGAA